MLKYLPHQTSLRKTTWIVLLWLPLAAFSHQHSSDQAEKVKVRVNVRNTPLKDVFKLISRQTGLTFFGSNSGSYDMKVSLHAADTELTKLLDDLLSPLNFSWEISGKVIIIRKKSDPPMTPQSMEIISSSPARPAMAE
ncbi:STN domain-containing protein [Chitinophaga sp. HK235]|uniref:STN domain-containing protein n=1 Tax=Chitinophaga sp. HK235 TaxID=2952571 RepID=UPI001BACAF13|nr:STN domain-containing protein [Chitinophaga sp. HK235]